MYIRCINYFQDGSAAIRVKKDDSPWGPSDFAPADQGGQSTGAYDWGGEAPAGDFFSDMLSNPKQVRTLVVLLFGHLYFLTFFTFRRRLPVWGSGSCRDFHRSPSVAHSDIRQMFHAFRSLLTVSFHRNLDLPLGRFRSIFIYILFVFCASYVSCL